MEKMFVYPETLESSVTWEMALEDVENPHSRAGVASHRCKLYRTLLGQRTASQQALRGWIDDERAANSAHA